MPQARGINQPSKWEETDMLSGGTTHVTALLQGWGDVLRAILTRRKERENRGEQADN
jgi:hypothetical protein